MIKKVIIVKKNDKNKNHRDDDDNNNKDELQIRGIAIIDIERYWNNENIFQIVYIDADSESLLSPLINKSIELTLNYNNKNNNNNNKTINKFEKIQLFSPYREYNSKIFNESDISFSEQFLLYYKKI